MAIVPVELVWWWLVKVGASWTMGLTVQPSLVGHLAQRAGVGINLTWLNVDIGDPTQEALTGLGEDLKREVKIADGLAPIPWEQTGTKEVKRVAAVLFVCHGVVCDE